MARALVSFSSFTTRFCSARNWAGVTAEGVAAVGRALYAKPAAAKTNAASAMPASIFFIETPSSEMDGDPDRRASLEQQTTEPAYGRRCSIVRPAGSLDSRGFWELPRLDSNQQ